MPLMTLYRWLLIVRSLSFFCRVCRSWNFILTQKSLTDSRVCVVKSGEEAYGSYSYDQPNYRVGTHMQKIRRAASSLVTDTLVLVFHCERKSAGPCMIFLPVWLQLCDVLKEVSHVRSLVMVNACVSDGNFLTWFKDCRRPLELKLVNCTLRIVELIPKLNWKSYAIPVEKMSVQLSGNYQANHRGLVAALQDIVWPFKSSKRIDWIVKNAPLLRRSERRRIQKFLREWW